MTEHEVEFSFEVDLTKLPRTGKTFRLQANESECGRVAARLRVFSVKTLTGEMHISATPKMIIIHGSVKAVLTRECVASLEEMTETIDDAFEVEFARIPAEAAPEEDENENWQAPEVHEGAIFDIGELLVQQLSLAMDPFPRKEGAVSLAETYGAAVESSPFSSLQGKFGKTEKKQ